jgi:Tfp pilus assembly protein PilN
MARHTDVTLGVDLLGIAPASVAIRNGNKGLQVVDAARGTVSINRQVGGAILRGADLTIPLLASYAGATVSVGAPEVPEGGTIQKTEFTSPGEVHKTQNNLADQVLGLEKVVKHYVPIPRPRDGTWGYVEVQARAAAVMQTIDHVQSQRADEQPLIDARVVALFRVAQSFASLSEDEHVLLTHVDTWDTLHILFVKQTPRIVLQVPGGLGQLATAAAQQNGCALEAGLTAVITGPVPPASLAAFTLTMEDAASVIRTKLKDWSAISESAIGARKPMVGLPRATSAPIARWLISGVLADRADITTVAVKGLSDAKLNTFRPLAQCAGATAAQKAHAGAYTVALGHALNTRGTRNFATLPLDLTVRMPIELLDASRRDPMTVVQTKRVAGKRVARPQFSSDKLERLERARPWLMIAAVLILVGSLVIPRVKERVLDREITTLTADTLAAAERILNMTNLQQEVSEMKAKREALAGMSDARRAGVRTMTGTAAAMDRASREVWLTTLTAVGPTELRYEGTTRSQAALASYIDGIRAESLYTDVSLESVKRREKDHDWSFALRARVKPLAGLLPRPTTAVPGGPPGVVR